MNTLVHADIFFFATTIVLIVVGIGLVIAIIYLIKILKDVSYISKKIKSETDAVVGDIALLREHVKNDGVRFKFLRAFFTNIFRRYKKKDQ